MKSFFTSYISVLLIGFASVTSSCTKEVVEPITPASTTAYNSSVNRSANSSFKNGNYIVQFQNDPALQLNTNTDIENLAESIAGAQITFTDIYNFEGYKGFAAYLTKQQAIKFNSDTRVMVIEPDAPIGPM